jgi:replicative DNA helicase
MAEVEPIPSSIPDLDECLSGGYRPGWLIIAGAFTAGGKTTFCVREAVHKASLEHPVLYVSCELGAVEVARKIDLASAEDGQPPLDLPIWVEDGVTDLPAVISCIEDWAESRDGGMCPLVILDYLQRVRAGSQANREREVATVAEELQQLARRTGIILVAAAQLNRQSQSDEKPSLHHLRESGLIEQTADVALLLTKTGPDQLRVSIGKNRWGASGHEVNLSVDFAKARIGALTEAQQMEPLARRVVEFLTGEGGRAKVRDISRRMKINGRHPSTPEIVTAASTTKLFSVANGEAMLV